MHKPAHVLEVFLQPGEYHFGSRETRMRTILGSCVSLTFWHPQLLLGGMSHIMLPSRSSRIKGSSSAPDGKYADEALELVIADMKNAGTAMKDYQVKLFGGGDMFAQTHGQQQVRHIGSKNIDAVQALIKRHGVNCHAQHIGGMGHRYIVFEVWSGHVWVRHQAMPYRAGTI